MKPILILLLSVYSILTFAASPGEIRTRTPADQLVPIVAEYKALKGQAKENRSAKFKMAQIELVCAKTTDVSVKESCSVNEVDAKRGLATIISLAESGYIPAQVFYARYVPTKEIISDPRELNLYKARVERYLEEGIRQGSGEAMYLKARDLQRVSPRSLLTFDQAKQAYVLAAAAVECGYPHEHAFGLLYKLMNEFEFDISEVKGDTEQVVQKFCLQQGRQR